MSKKVTITIAPNGNATVAASGYTGKSCYQATKPYEDLMTKDKTDEKTSDFYKTEQKLRDTE